ncbi:HMR1 protein, partial [Amia calva]|nr:HMR1 protein [Amia calva]
MALIMMCIALTETHSLTALRMGTTDGTELPEHIAMWMVDDVRYSYYNSTVGKPVPLFDWFNTTEGREFWDRRFEHMIDGHKIFQWSVRKIAQDFNHTGVHTYQYVGRCELDDDGTKRVKVYHACDGKDFISLDVHTMSWVAVVPQAVVYKRKREADPASQQIISRYYRKDCFDFLKTFLKFGKETLQRKVRPEVSVIDRKDSRSAGVEVLCHVTGFYPRTVNASWVRDGQAVLEEGLWRGEVLPNGDGTYQLRKTLTVSAEEQEKRSYSCRVEHSSLEEPMTVKWGKTQRYDASCLLLQLQRCRHCPHCSLLSCCLLCVSDPQAAQHTGIIAGVLAAALGLIAVLIVIIWRRRAGEGVGGVGAGFL